MDEWRRVWRVETVWSEDKFAERNDSFNEPKPWGDGAEEGVSRSAKRYRCEIDGRWEEEVP